MTILKEAPWEDRVTNLPTDGDSEATRKVLWLADHIHGTIPVSRLEMKVVSTQIFNRLHNILQNSTVYLTYPSNRTSRFSHSIGCMHLAGEIFRQSMLNAKNEDRIRFLEEFFTELKAVEGDSRFHDELKNHMHQRPAGELYHPSPAQLGDPLYLAALPGSLSGGTERLAFITAYQALRLVALLHDLGHPPFSHVTEYALQDIYADIRDAGRPTNPREEEFERIVEWYVGPENSFHESLGARLAGEIFSGLLQDPIGDRRCFDLLRIKFLVDRIFSAGEGIGVLHALHRVVDGALDADRLDYVPRDNRMSGAGEDGAVYNRLLPSFEFSYGREEDQPVGPMFLPSVRALSNVEEFFQKRVNVFKYVVFHHRVAKTDALLRSVIRLLARKYFDHDEEVGVEERYLLPTHISGLWRTLDPEENIFETEVVASYIQWDDSWLLAVLRRHYFRLAATLERLREMGRGLPEQDGLLLVQLEEVLSNKKYYDSLFKGVDSFIAVDEGFLDHLGEVVDWQVIREVVGSPLDWSSDLGPAAAGRGPIDALLDELVLYHQEFLANGRAVCVGRREDTGFFIVRLLELLRLVQLGLPQSLVFADPAFDLLKAEFGLDDVIVRPTFLKPGVDRDFPLAKHDRRIRLSELSRVADELKRSANLFPPFFLFFFSSVAFSEAQKEEMRRKLGKHLARCFGHFLNSRREEIVEN